MGAAIARDICRGGVSAGTSQAINGTIATGLTGAGTTITDALDLVASVNTVTSCAIGAGVQLPSMQLGDECIVYNAVQANGCYLYPDQSTVAINQLSAGAGVIIPPQTACRFVKVTATQIVAFMSR